MLIHVWVPGRFDRVGGIQAFSRFFVEALTATCDVRVLSLHDKGRDGCGDVSTPWRNLSFARMVFFAALRDRPDRIVLTHLHFAPVAKIIALLLRIPFDVVAHGVEAWRIDRKIVRWSLKSAERVLAVSKTTRERMYESGLVPMGRIQLLPNTADEDRFSLRPLDAVLLSRFGINAASRFLLTVCRLDASEQYKGYDGVIRALPDVIQVFPDVHYILVGDGDDRPRVERLIADLGLRSRVTCVGRVTDSDLPLFYNAASLFLMPGWGEGFGIVFLEALFSGVPCLGSVTDGSKDALCHGELGVLVHPGDDAELVEGIISSLRAPTDRVQLRCAALERFGLTAFRGRVKELFASGETFPSVSGSV